jgi:hypothetical protein
MGKYQRFSLNKREMIVQLLSKGKSLRFIAESLGINVRLLVVRLNIFLPVVIGINHGWLTIVIIIFLLDIIAAEG